MPPAHQPTPETRAMVKTLASFGVPQSDIGAVVGVHPDTLRIHYRAELDLAGIQANAKVASFLFTAASGRALEMGLGARYADCIRAAMFWMKTRGGWRETSNLEIRPGEDLGGGMAAFQQAVIAAMTAELEASPDEDGDP